MSHTIIDSNALPAATFPDMMKELYTINFNIVASAVLLFWDILLTFDREVEYIWKSKISLITVLFEGIRLLAVGGEILFLVLGVGVFSFTDSSCKDILWFEAMLGMIMSTGSDILLIFRVYALYERNKILLVSLCIIEAMAFVAVFSTIVKFAPQGGVAPDPFPHLHIGSCLLPKLSSDVWIPILCVQTILFGLAVGRFLYFQWKGPIMISRLYYTFIRDGIWCFFILFVIYVLCIVGVKLQSTLGLVSLYWCFPLMGICTSRLILNLRSATSGFSQDYSLDVSRTDTKLNFGGGEFTCMSHTVIIPKIPMKTSSSQCPKSPRCV